MNYLESKGFPLPDSMTEAQYEQILKYETKRGQTLYLDAIVEGQDQNEEAIEKIMAEEKSLFQPLQVDPEILEELVGSDVEKKVNNLPTVKSQAVDRSTIQSSTIFGCY